MHREHWREPEEHWREPEQLIYLEDIQELLAGGCQQPNCTHDHSSLIMHSQCHFKGPTIVVFLKDKPYLVVACDVCNTPIAYIAVATRPKEQEKEDVYIE